MATPPPPDDLPKSPSGRIPKWVVDEAMGKPVEAPGFRSYGVPDPLAAKANRRPSTARRWTSALLAIALVTGLVYVAQRLGLNAASTPVAVASMPGGFGLDDAAATAGHPVNGPAPGVDEAPSPLGSPAPLPGKPSRSYRFQSKQDDGTSAVAWSPCRPIHYVVRTANQPRGGAAGIQRAIAAVSAATGLQFVRDANTDEAPDRDRDAYQPDRYGDRWAPVLVAWATVDEVPDFGVDVAGEAMTQRVTTPSGDEAFVTGAVLLDPASYREISRYAGRAAADAVILHEFGHLVGLDHVNDRAQVMYPRSGPGSPTAFQRGDLTGLAALGLGACQPDV